MIMFLKKKCKIFNLKILYKFIFVGIIKCSHVYRMVHNYLYICEKNWSVAIVHEKLNVNCSQIYQILYQNDSV